MLTTERTEPQRTIWIRLRRPGEGPSFNAKTLSRKDAKFGLVKASGGRV